MLLLYEKHEYNLFTLCKIYVMCQTDLKRGHFDN